jgi:hypothetical protein
MKMGHGPDSRELRSERNRRSEKCAVMIDVLIGFRGHRSTELIVFCHHSPATCEGPHWKKQGQQNPGKTRHRVIIPDQNKSSSIDHWRDLNAAEDFPHSPAIDQDAPKQFSLNKDRTATVLQILSSKDYNALRRSAHSHFQDYRLYAQSCFEVIRCCWRRHSNRGQRRTQERTAIVGRGFSYFFKIGIRATLQFGRQ